VKILGKILASIATGYAYEYGKTLAKKHSTDKGKAELKAKLDGLTQRITQQGIKIATERALKEAGKTGSPWSSLFETEDTK
jgi:hypothetical protein